MRGKVRQQTVAQVGGDYFLVGLSAHVCDQPSVTRKIFASNDDSLGNTVTGHQL
ncbi:hypothetical protein D3C71_2031210 [compost metagenome]